MKLTNYISQTRSRIDDDPVSIDPFHSDEQMTVFINNARRKINMELLVYENQQFIIPEQYIDEYPLEPDYLRYSTIIDIYKQFEISPISKENAETTKNYIGSNIVAFQNLCYINEKRKAITFTNPFETAEPVYTVASFSRSGKYIIVDSSTGTMGDIMKWDTCKGYIKITGANGDIEYCRVSKILANTPTTGSYKLIISSSDLKNSYYNNLQLTGTVTSTTGLATVIGTNTIFLTELAAGNTITIHGVSYTVQSIESNTSLTLSTNASSSQSNSIAYMTNYPTFQDGDTLQFVTYIFNYISYPSELVYMNEDDRMPLETQEIVPILTAVECGLRQSRTDIYSTNMNEYEEYLQRTYLKMKKEQAYTYNKTIEGLM